MLTSPNVVEFWAYMQSEFGSTVHEKGTSELMQVAASFLDILKIQDKEQFLKDFVTTVGKRIYTPFKVGVENDQWSLWGQVRVCVHEHQHIVQGERDGWAEYDLRYLTSSSFRAGYEAEAFGCDMEMEFWRTEDLLDINRRVAVLKDYGCSDADIEQAAQMLEIRAGMVAQGIVSNTASIKAIEWLDSNVQGLRCV